MGELMRALSNVRLEYIALLLVVVATVGLPTIGRLMRFFRRRSAARRLWGQRPATGLARVIDGDTIEVLRQRVRLFGMDAPEMDQPGGDAAQRRLIALIDGRQVRVRPLCVDVYGRVVARVTCDRRDLLRAMVWEGYARSAPQYSWDYIDSEIVARLMGRGLWATSRLWGIDAPWEHRRRMNAVRQGLGRQRWR